MLLVIACNKIKHSHPEYEIIFLYDSKGGNYINNMKFNACANIVYGPFNFLTTNY